MYGFIIVLIVIVAILLVFIVMIQNSKGGGLAAGFSSSNQVMGVRKTTDFLEKATWGLAGSMVLLCIVATFFAPKQIKATKDSELKEEIQNSLIANPEAISPFTNQDAAQQPEQEPAQKPAE